MSTTIRSDGVANCGFVEVADLVAAAISGGAVVGIMANAGMFGDSAAWTITSTSSNTLPSGESIVEGMGMVVKIGDNPAVNVAVFDVGGKPLQPSQLNFFRQRFAAFLNYYPQFRGFMLQ
jgi:hypothetical protein